MMKAINLRPVGALPPSPPEPRLAQFRPVGRVEAGRMLAGRSLGAGGLYMHVLNACVEEI